VKWAAASDRTGRYQLRWRLGRGGMGVVWPAEDQALHRTVAVRRVVLSGSGPVEDRIAAHTRALYEEQLAARVDHPGTVRVYNVVEAAGHPWIVMEVLIGRTLAEVSACRPATTGHRVPARQGPGMRPGPDQARDALLTIQ
jgi:serine/threonine protein kinase